MPGVARVKDSITTGHTCDVTASLKTSGQDNTVKANGRDICVVGALVSQHTIMVGSSCVPHIARLNAGSHNVYVNGIGVGRIGDSADLGSVTSGSNSVFVN